MNAVDTRVFDEQWTEDERQWYAMGPFDGQIPGLVRRVRRVLDVSQRGLAALLEVSQSVVARWETGRVSPRASVLHELLQMARLNALVRDEDGVEVTPMRDDGARDRAGRRHPAHVDLTVRGWWVPRGSESTAHYLLWKHRSRLQREPQVRFHNCAWRRGIQRMLFGVPDDHPSLLQLAAEAEHFDERRADRRERARSGRHWPTVLSSDLPRPVWGGSCPAAEAPLNL